MKTIIFLVSEDWNFLLYRASLAKYCHEKRNKVVIVCRGGNDIKNIEEMGFQTKNIRLSRGSINPIREFLTLLDIYKIYRAERPYLVHHFSVKLSMYGTIAARISGVPKIINSITGLGTLFTHSALSLNVKNFFLEYIVLRTMFFLASSARVCTIVQNKEDFSIFRERCLASKLVLIQGSGVDVNKFSPQKEPEGTIRVTMVSRMLRDKGVLELVEAAKRLQQKNIPCIITLVGDTDLENPTAISREEIWEWVNNGYVEWWGHQKDIVSVWARSHIAVLPSYREGLPKSLLEAGACSRVVIASDIAGCRELIQDKVNGLLVPARNSEMLAEGIRELVENKEYRLKLGSNLRARIKKYFSDRIINEQIYMNYER